MTREQEVSLFLQSLEQQSSVPASQFLASLGDQGAERRATGPRPEGGTLGNIGEAIASPISALFSQKGRGNLGVVAEGALEGALLNPSQALLQLPGLFTEQELASDRAADFIKRLKVGVFSTAEERALAAGMTPKEIADSHAVGNFIGFTVPTVASIKAASLIVRAPVAVSSALTASNLINDLTAGALFGALLEPGETIDDRIKNMLQQSALFGVGRVMIAGLALPFKAYRLGRAIQYSRGVEVEEMIARMEAGLPVQVNTSDQSVGLARLLTEEEMVSSSSAAQEIVRNREDVRAVVTAIRAASSEGRSGALVHNLGKDYFSVVKTIDELRPQFPGVKFSAPVKLVDQAGYSVYMGQKGLNKEQLSQLKATGRFAGQAVEKLGSTYEIVNPAEDAAGRILVKTSDGKTVKIKTKGMTSRLEVRESLDAPDRLMMDELFNDFRDKVFNSWSGTTQSIQGDLNEADLIRAIRDGKLKVTDQSKRAFEVSGAITYPEELGMVAGESGQLIPRAGGAAIPFKTKQEAEAILQSLGPMAGMYTPQFDFVTVEQVLNQISRSGTAGANILQSGGSILNFEDMVTAWAKQTGLPIAAEDFATMQSHFAQRMRETMWKLVPEEDMRVFNSIRDSFIEGVEKGEIPIEAAAHGKGFSLSRLSEGRVELRDLRTGLRLEFGSLPRAEEFLLNTIRSDSNMLGDPFNMGSGGMAALGGGFAHTDGVFNIDGSIPGAESFVKDLSPFSGLQNVRDMLVRIEDSVGLPVFSSVFDGLDRAISKRNAAIEPWAYKIEKIWKPLSTREATQVGRAWSDMEARGLNDAQAVAEMQALKFSPKQINAFKESRKVFDTLFQLTGIDNKRYIQLYYSHVLPYAERNGGRVDLGRIFGPTMPPEFRFFAEMQRTGDLAMQEANPAVVMHQYVRGLFFNREVAPLYERARAMVAGETTPRMKDLAPAQRMAIEEAAGRAFHDNDAVLADPLRQYLSEYLNVIRGMPTTTQKTFTGWAKKFFSVMGVRVEDRAVEEMANVALSVPYGAALAFRPAQVARNQVQSWWTMYPRVGAKHYSKALEAAMSLAGAEESILAGANRSTEAGVPFGEQTFRSMMDRVPIEGSGAASRAMAATMRLGLRTGNLSRKLASVGMVPYSSADSMERAVVYFWQKLHTAEQLERYEAGKISWETFAEDGMPFFHNVVKQKFSQMYNKFGKEEALRWIGKQAADEANFIYGAGAQPGWLQSAPGRFLGMFATWPLWAVELYGRRVWNGSPKQIAAFTARTLALVGAFSNMAIQSGYNMWNWIAPMSTLSYAGGPVVDAAIQLKRVADAPLDQKADALASMAKNVGRLSVPGQLAYVDVRDALESSDPAKGAMRMLLGRPNPKSNWMIDVVYNPSNREDVYQWPESEAAQRSLDGLHFPKVPLGVLP